MEPLSQIQEVTWDAEDGDEGDEDDSGAQEVTQPPRRRRRRRVLPRTKAEPARAQRLELRRGALDGDLSRALVVLDETPRPQVRGDCLAGGPNAARPCPWFGCKYHLGLDVNPDTGTIHLREVDELIDSCSLDVADRGGITLEEVGDRMNLTRERVRQVEYKAAMQLRPRLAEALNRGEEE